MVHVRLPDHLFRRGKGYSVRFSVPKKYQGVLGEKEIIRGLGTQDLGEAISKRDEVLAEIRETIRSGGELGTRTASEPRVNLKPTQGTTVRDTGFNGRLWDECLNEHLFTSLTHARGPIAACREDDVLALEQIGAYHRKDHQWSPKHRARKTRSL